MSSNIVIIGGHGKIALITERLLAERSDSVRGIIRNPDQTDDVAATGAEAVVGDVATLDVEGLADLLAGAEAVVWAAGAGGGDPERTYAVDRDAAIRTIDAAAQVGVRRFVMVSYFGASTDHGVPDDNPFFAYAEAKAAADEYLRASSLDWTVLGPSALTNDPATGRIDATASEASNVARADVAAVIAATLHDPATIGRTITFNTGETEIAEAIA